jgi:hypothetical protein
MMTPEERARFTQEVRSRIALIAAERSLPKSETAKVMGVSIPVTSWFAERHRISLDWLICAT